MRNKVSMNFWSPVFIFFYLQKFIIYIYITFITYLTSSPVLVPGAGFVQSVLGLSSMSAPPLSWPRSIRALISSNLSLILGTWSTKYLYFQPRFYLFSASLTIILYSPQTFVFQADFFLHPEMRISRWKNYCKSSPPAHQIVGGGYGIWQESDGELWWGVWPPGPWRPAGK